MFHYKKQSFLAHAIRERVLFTMWLRLQSRLNMGYMWWASDPLKQPFLTPYHYPYKPIQSLLIPDLSRDHRVRTPHGKLTRKEEIIHLVIKFVKRVKIIELKTLVLVVVQEILI